MEEKLYRVALMEKKELIIESFLPISQWEKEQENDPELVRIAKELEVCYDNIEEDRKDEWDYGRVSERELRQYLTSPIYLEEEEDFKGENAFEIKEGHYYDIWKYNGNGTLDKIGIKDIGEIYIPAYNRKIEFEGISFSTDFTAREINKIDFPNWKDEVERDDTNMEHLCLTLERVLKFNQVGDEGEVFVDGVVFKHVCPDAYEFLNILIDKDDNLGLWKDREFVKITKFPSAGISYNLEFNLTYKDLFQWLVERDSSLKIERGGFLSCNDIDSTLPLYVKLYDLEYCSIGCQEHNRGEDIGDFGIDEDRGYYSTDIANFVEETWGRDYVLYPCSKEGLYDFLRHSMQEMEDVLNDDEDREVFFEKYRYMQEVAEKVEEYINTGGYYEEMAFFYERCQGEVEYIPKRSMEIRHNSELLAKIALRPPRY